MRLLVVCLFIWLLISSFPAIAAPLSMHLMAVEGLSVLAKNEQQGFQIGLASHILLDLLVEESVWDWRSAREWERHKKSVAIELLMLYLLLKDKPDATEKAARWGALLPDLIDGLFSLLHPELWERGILLMPWHISW